MVRGFKGSGKRESGDRPFDDTGMNPSGKKDLPKSPTKATLKKQLNAIGNNVTGKHNKGN